MYINIKLSEYNVTIKFQVFKSNLNFIVIKKLIYLHFCKKKKPTTLLFIIIIIFIHKILLELICTI